jgi:two-component system, cell cycle sensor histidine kinase and response regulator CckA
MLEAAPLGVVECDIDGGIVRWNRGAADLLEWPRWLPGAEVPGELPVEAREAIRVAATGHRTEGIAATVSRTGSRDAEVRISASPITDPGGNVEGVLVLVDDVTEHQQLEQHIRQAQRLEAMARLAGGIAHDFNNLLTVVRGHSEVLLKTLDPDDDRREDAEAIRVASHRAAELTKQLLTIGRRQQVEPHVLDLHERARELAPVLRRLVGDDVDLRVVISPTAGHVRVDPGDLDQTIMNLVINARDAMPSGGRIMVETRNIEMRPRGASLAGVTAGRYVLVTVADTGSGMPRNVVEHCFDPFFSTKGRGKGTGLGLALVYSTATRAGGHATVESEVGRGTTFRVWFPEVDPANEQPVPAATRRRRRSGRIATKPCRILLVDDEAPVRSLARTALEDAGHELMEAASAEEAMQKAESERQPFDLLVSDIVLGAMRGDELAVMMRKKWKRLRVVLMSGYTDQPMILEPDGFLAKPFALDDLTALVAGVMGLDPPEAPLPAPATKPPAKKPPPKKRAQGSKR